MSWVALLLIGVGITDLVFSARPMRWLPEVIGAAGVVGLGLAAGLTSPRDLGLTPGSWTRGVITRRLAA